MAASSTGSTFPVTSSSVAVYYDDQPLSEEEEEEGEGESSNVGMIVGVVVGVIAVVAIVGFVAFKVCKSKRAVQQQEVGDQQSNIQVMPREVEMPSHQ